MTLNVKISKQVALNTFLVVCFFATPILPANVRAYFDELCYATSLSVDWSKPSQKFEVMGFWYWKKDIDITWDCSQGSASSCDICHKVRLRESTGDDKGPWAFVNANITLHNAPECGTSGNLKTVTSSANNLGANTWYEVTTSFKKLTAASDCEDAAGYTTSQTVVFFTS